MGVKVNRGNKHTPRYDCTPTYELNSYAICLKIYNSIYLFLGNSGTKRGIIQNLPEFLQKYWYCLPHFLLPDPAFQLIHVFDEGIFLFLPEIPDLL